MKASLIRWFERVMLGALGVLRDWADADQDGDVDTDDLGILYERTMEVVSEAAETIAGWATLTVGQRIDAVIAILKAEFPQVRTSMWVILEAIAHFVLLLKAKVK